MNQAYSHFGMYRVRRDPWEPYVALLCFCHLLTDSGILQMHTIVASVYFWDGRLVSYIFYTFIVSTTVAASRDMP